MHTPTTTSVSNARQEIAHLLDPSYHRPSASPTPSHLSEIWTDAAGGTHDPDFRPFITSTNNTRRSSFNEGSGRRSFELPSAPVTPTKDEMRAARRALQPDLREALKAHEREMRRVEEEERMPAWLRRARAKSSPALAAPLYHPSAVPPASVPDFSSAMVGDDSDEDDDGHSVDEHEKHHMHFHTGEQLRRQLASLSLKVDLAVFRAKKRIRRKVGLD